MKVLILGVGNLLLTDEGIGVHTVNALLRDYDIPKDVEVVDGGTSGMELLTLIAEADHLILLDAAKTGQPPGSMIRLDDDEVPAFFRTKISPHQVGLSDVLAAAQLTGEQPNHVTFFGVEPKSMALGMELTDKIAPQVIRLIELVIKELDKLGFKMESKL
ncbi:HyaD/HybD family hydrogenase maturation endopeptidase [Candidatus Parabeggiatoa sp. HSG14]|uniref:HyaD/HybD family hydrogenase maturation endopeptidase n=1 Tax=Candidatus Parabeggiatoa sp. HSG14 TaxID=3055593 RepID=UPI0025A835D3|nr:HyaD/HybD family hydrogenase maturation endopeptidase [Thiotrichales bacterium HSG14]